MNVITNWFRLLLGNPQLVILVFTLVLGLCAVLWVGNMVAPILASVIIAYLLDGLANPLRRLRIPRFVGIVVVYLGFLALLAFIVFAIVPILSQQATQLVSQIPGMLAELRDVLMRLPHRYPEFVSESQVNQIAGAIGYEAMTLGRGMVTASVSSVFGVITLGIYLVLMPAPRLLHAQGQGPAHRLGDRLPAPRPPPARPRVDGRAPPARELRAREDHRDPRRLGRDLLHVRRLRARLRGAPLLPGRGLGADPYVGAIAVTIPVAIVAYVQWGIGPDFAYLMLAYLAVQVLDGNVLVPLLFSEVVNMPPDCDHRRGPGVRRAVGVLGDLLRHSPRHPDPVRAPRVAAPRADRRRDVVTEGAAQEAARGVPAFADVEAAARRIAPQVRRTPVVTSPDIDREVGAEVAFKCENLQRAGAFKFRGASNAVLSLSDPEAAGGVCTHSSGNHGAALALAARLRSIPATVVMPAGAPRVKRRAVESFGGEVVECEPTLAAREAALRTVVGRRGGRVVHPYDDFHVDRGPGHRRPRAPRRPAARPVVRAPRGAGGRALRSGGRRRPARWKRPGGAHRGRRVFGAEPAGADDAMRSLRAGRIIPVEAPDTVADGLLTSLGERNFAIIRRKVEDILTVSEDSILAAMRLLWERTKLVVEPSGAVPLAALLEHGPPPGCARIGVVVSGGNFDLDAARFPVA